MSKIYVDEIRHSGGAVAALQFDSSGRVTMPAVPAWRAALAENTNQTMTTAGMHTVQLANISTSNCFANGGVTIDSYQIVAPISGVYAVNAYARVDGVGSGYLQCVIQVNDVDTGVSDSYAIDGGVPANYTTIHISDHFQVSANDTFGFKVYTSADTSWNLNSFGTVFSGHLVG